jgi:hypothetical protein
MELNQWDLQTKRAYEVEAYHRMYFTVTGYHIEFRSCKEEDREATDAERDMWNALTELTPETPELDMGEINLWKEHNFKVDGYVAGDLVWLKNQEDMYLCKVEDWGDGPIAVKIDHAHVFL